MTTSSIEQKLGHGASSEDDSLVRRSSKAEGGRPVRLPPRHQRGSQIDATSPLAAPPLSMERSGDPGWPPDAC